MKGRSMTKKNGVVCLALLLAGSIAGLAQVMPVVSGNAVDQQKLRDAASEGIPLGTVHNPQVRVEAVLLPERVCRRVFGKEISQNYVAVELTVSNKTHDAAFLIHSVFIDYGDWLLSGSPQSIARFTQASSAPVPAQQDPGGPFTQASRAPVPAQPDPGGLYSNSATQVASVEYRVVRGEALDAQQWTSRNWTMRALTLAGVLATGSEFAFKEQNITKAISQFTGQVVPGAATFWPDGTVPQLDRISDFGFRTNKVIPKEGADIVVGFFPLDRFITPTLKKIFLKSPALFFMPAAAFVDPKTDRRLKEMMTKLLPSSAGTAPTLTAILATREGKAMLDGISLNNVRVWVSGIMAVDVDTIPARIDSITFDGTPDWTKSGTITGVIHGALLTNGQPAIAEDLKLDPKAVTAGSTDTELHFSLTLPEGGVPGCTLTFHVTKSKDSKTADSNSRPFTVPGTAGTNCAPAK